MSLEAGEGVGSRVGNKENKGQKSRGTAQNTDADKRL